MAVQDNNEQEKKNWLADLPLTLEPLPMRTENLEDYTYQKLDYAMIAGMDRTPGGRLWVAWFGGGDSDKGYMLLASSDDEGKTWSQPRGLLRPDPTPHGFTHRVLVGNLWTDPLGRLWCFYDRSLSYFDGRGGTWATVCANPDADKPVWSHPQRLWQGMALNKPVVLRNGEWLLPVSLWGRECIHHIASDTFKEFDGWRMANVLVSKDQGASWHWRGKVAAEQRIFDEPMFIERADGSLLMLIRTGYGIARTVSLDGGRNWTTPQHSDIPHVSARFFLRKLSSGRTLLVKHGGFTEATRAYGRTHLTAWLSDDDGENWYGGLVLDERKNISYPDGFQSPDGRIFIAYDRERAAERELYLAVFTEEDIKAGAEVSGRSRLCGLISKALG